MVRLCGPAAVRVPCFFQMLGTAWRTRAWANPCSVAEPVSSEPGVCLQPNTYLRGGFPPPILADVAGLPGEVVARVTWGHSREVEGCALGV